jgi:ATP-dependent RNA helicase SUPV3L1/SUV3
LIKPAASALCALLWAVHRRLDLIPTPPTPGLTSFTIDKESQTEITEAFLAAAFFRVAGERAVRLDILERIEETLAKAAKAEQNAGDSLNAIVSLLGCSKTEAERVAVSLGYRRIERPAKMGLPPQPVWQRIRSMKHRAQKKARSRPVTVRGDSPFAGLVTLIASD